MMLKFALYEKMWWQPYPMQKSINITERLHMFFRSGAHQSLCVMQISTHFRAVCEDKLKIVSKINCFKDELWN